MTVRPALERARLWAYGFQLHAHKSRGELLTKDEPQREAEREDDQQHARAAVTFRLRRNRVHDRITLTGVIDAISIAAGAGRATHFGVASEGHHVERLSLTA